MRTLVLFALTLAATAAFTTDASAFGRRRAAASNGGCDGGGYVTSGYGGCYGSGYSSYSSGGCYGSGYVSSGYGGCYGSGYVASGYGGCYGSGYSSYNSGGCYGSGYALHGSVAYSRPVSYSVAYSNGSYGATSWVPVTVNGGRAGMIQTTDGAYYTLGADGIYYPATWNGVAILNGPTVVSRTSGYSPEANLGSSVIPAGGTVPLTTSTTTTTNTFRAKQVLGTRILIQNDAQVGTVEDLVSDGAGNTDYLIVSTGDNNLVTVPWDAVKFDPERKTATVNVTQDVWRTVPTYTVTTYPQFYTPAYRTDIYKVYGVTPRDSRRIP